MVVYTQTRTQVDTKVYDDESTRTVTGLGVGG